MKRIIEENKVSIGLLQNEIYGIMEEQVKSFFRESNDSFYSTKFGKCEKWSEKGSWRSEKW